MSRAFRTFVGALALLLGAAIPLIAQDPSEGTGPREVVVPFRGPQAGEAPAALRALFDRFADAWEDRDARAVAGLTRDGRVHVVMERDGVAARLSAGQLQVLLEEIFEEAEGVALYFPRIIAYDDLDRTGYGVGQRVYRPGPGLEPRVDRVFAGARVERGRWVLTELRLSAE
ncbi:MAG: hypothetical protein R3199_09730 [Gemmatimonadota bacterium]|nr:hypothetical protein [Gemmatimonadota bacterium]